MKELCRTDFLVFQKVELGMEIGPQHKIWWDHLKTKEDVVEMAPRDHGKSHSLTRAYAAWRLKYDPWVRDAIILGPDAASAVENLDKMKEMMRDSPSLAHLLPIGRSKGNPDSRTETKLTNGKVVKAKGYFSPLRGRHPQLIICDDCLNEKNCYSKDARQEMLTRFNDVIVPMKDKGTRRSQIKGYKSQIVVVGTAQDREDMYHELMKNPEYRGAKLKAIVDEERKIALWPDRYTYEDLMGIKRRVGALSFSKEYMNEPLSDETTIFPYSLFEPCFDSSMTYAKNYTSGKEVYMGVDFSVPGTLDGDWTVIVVLEYDRTDNVYRLLNYWRARPSNITEQLRQIEYFCQMYNVTMGYMEDNMFQGIYREHFKNKSSLPLKGHTVNAQNKRSLETGVLSLRPILENQRFIFPYQLEADKQRTDYLVSEFSGVKQKHGRIGNETSNDDLVMAIWHAVCASRTVLFEADF